MKRNIFRSKDRPVSARAMNNGSPYGLPGEVFLPGTMLGHWRIHEGTAEEGFDRQKREKIVKGAIIAATTRLIPRAIGSEIAPDGSDEVYWYFCKEGVPRSFGNIFKGSTKIQGDVMRGQHGAVSQYLSLNIRDLLWRNPPEQMTERVVEADRWLSEAGLIGLDLLNPDQAIDAEGDARERFEESVFNEFQPR